MPDGPTSHNTIMISAEPSSKWLRQLVLLSLPDNDRCFDCGDPHADWCSVSHACMLCIRCAGAHRGLGVATDTVRSVQMDEWSEDELTRVRLGGNGRLRRWFVTQQVDAIVHEIKTVRVYKTKALADYRAR